MAREVAQRHQNGEIATADPHHFVYHEVGHFLWRRDNPSRNARADDQMFRSALLAVRPHVSGRAARGPGEFVSEVFAQKLVGSPPVHADVEQLYRQLGGRPI